MSSGTNRHLAEEFFSQAIRGQQVYNSRQDLQYHNQLHVTMPTFAIAPDRSYVEFVLEVRDELTEKVWQRHQQWEDFEHLHYALCSAEPLLFERLMFPRKLTVLTEANIETRREQLCGYVEILRNLKVSPKAAAMLEDFLCEKHEVRRQQQHAAMHRTHQQQKAAQRASPTVGAALEIEGERGAQGRKGKWGRKAGGKAAGKGSPAGIGKAWGALKGAMQASHRGRSARGIKVGSDKQLGYLMVIEPDSLASEEELNKICTYKSTPTELDELFLACNPLSATFAKRLKDLDDINDRRQAMPRQVLNLIDRLKQYFTIEFNEEMRTDLLGNETGQKTYYIALYVTEAVLQKHAEEV
jgi:hypothetical protein